MHGNVFFQVDASSKGLGAALILDDYPVTFASKALTPDAPVCLQRMLLQLQDYDFTSSITQEKKWL